MNCSVPHHWIRYKHKLTFFLLFNTVHQVTFVDIWNKLMTTQQKIVILCRTCMFKGLCYAVWYLCKVVCYNVWYMYQVDCYTVWYLYEVGCYTVWYLYEVSYPNSLPHTGTTQYYSLDLDNLFSRIAIHSLDFNVQQFEGSNCNPRERVI